MCGIVGYVGSQSALEIVMAGLNTSLSEGVAAPCQAGAEVDDAAMENLQKGRHDAPEFRHYDIPPFHRIARISTKRSWGDGSHATVRSSSRNNGL